MFKNIDWAQASTKRGIVWLTVALIGLPMVWMGKDVNQLVVLGMGIAGGMGLLIKD